MKTMKQGKRAYRKRRRAESEEETRRRITEAAVELHGTIGPAHTTVTDLAKRAGVSRMTVYNHFPTDADVFKACSSHWAAENPLPDTSSWSEVSDPEERLRTGLHDLYRWYAQKQGMLTNILRDAPIVPAVGDLMEGFWGGFMADVTGTLTRDWPTRHGEQDELRAMIALAADFNSWRVLTSHGMDDDDAADVAADLVIGAVRLRSS